jgi:hypothetical protein
MGAPETLLVRAEIAESAEGRERKKKNLCALCGLCDLFGAPRLPPRTRTAGDSSIVRDSGTPHIIIGIGLAAVNVVAIRRQQQVPSGAKAAATMGGPARNDDIARTVPHYAADQSQRFKIGDAACRDPHIVIVRRPRRTFVTFRNPIAPEL